MKYGSWLSTIPMVLGIASGAVAQPLSFITEQQRLASYCAGVSEARMRELSEFIKTDCANPKRRDCVKANDELGKAQIMDRRLWAYLDPLYQSKDFGARQKSLSQEATVKGGDDWGACKRRPPGLDPDNLPACRESMGCLIDARFMFLPP